MRPIAISRERRSGSDWASWRVQRNGALRTTLTLDEDIAARIQAEVRRSGRPFEIVVNELLRVGLAQARKASGREPFRVETGMFGGLRGGLSLDNTGELLDIVEGEQRR
jgi:hypothetical protein